MTDYSGWTDEQVNEAIFKAKGWRKGVYVFGNLLDSWARKLDDGWIDVKNEIPDYTHDWRLCGDLLEEMLIGYYSPYLFWDCDEKAWACQINFDDGGMFSFIKKCAPTPQRAICEAWLAWKEQG